jgi:hypothetical protein
MTYSLSKVKRRYNPRDEKRRKGPHAARIGLKNPPKPRETPIAYKKENTNPIAKLIPTQNKTPP